MLKQLDSSGLVQVIDKVDNCESAINICIKPLIDKCYVEKKYKIAIKNNLDRYGINFIISPFIMLPHAKPEKGVNKDSISILKLNTPFYFAGNIPIKLIVIIAAKNSLTHLEILKDIAQVLNDDEKLKAILKSDNSNELIECFTS